MPTGCTQLRTTVGVDDEAPSTANGSLRVLYDDGTTYSPASTQLRPGRLSKVLVPVKGKFRIRLQTTARPLGEQGPYEDWFVVFGDAHFVCA